MVLPKTPVPWTDDKASRARGHFEQRERRLQEHASKAGSKLRKQPVDKDALLKAALARAKDRQQPTHSKAEPK